MKPTGRVATWMMPVLLMLPAACSGPASEPTAPALKVSAADGQVVSRSLDELLQAQGQINPLWYWVWIDVSHIDETGTMTGANIDYAGLDAAYLRNASGGAISLPTQVSGKVTERELPDGRAEVTVILHTKNANALVHEFSATEPYGITKRQLGYSPEELQAGGRTPSLVDCTLQMVFISDAMGAPLPDLFAVPFENIRVMKFYAAGPGILRPDSGEPDGTPGRLVVAQTGLLATGSGVPGHDYFPAEVLKFWAVGH